MSNCGAGVPHVARFIELDRLIGGLVLNTDETKLCYGQILHRLDPAYSALEELKSFDSSKQPYINYIKSQEGLIRDCWVAYKTDLQALIREIGYNCGFLFLTESGFEKGAKRFIDRYDPIIVNLNGFINKFRALRHNCFAPLAHLRRAIEHGHQSNKKSLRSTVRFGDAGDINIEDLEIIFNTTWLTIEEVIANFSIIKLVEGKIPVTISENRAYKNSGYADRLLAKSRYYLHGVNEDSK